MADIPLPLLTDEQVEWLQQYKPYSRFGGKCPTCDGSGSYRYADEDHECPDDSYGHIQERLFRLYSLAAIPYQFMVLDWEDFPENETKANIDEYVGRYEDFRRNGMGFEIFGGKLGIGKTWAATHIQRELAKLGYETWFSTFLEIKNLFEVTDGKRREQLTERILNVEMLVIDEVLPPPTSVAGASLFADKLEWVIRHRTSHNLVTVTTTNMVEADIRKFYPRVYSLLSAKQIREELVGTDYRLSAAFMTNAELAKNGERRPIL